jgi:hypothetical protein
VQRLRYYDRMKQDWIDVNASKASPESISILHYFTTLMRGGIYYVS